MKISVTFDLAETERKAINNYFGKPGLANYETAKSWIEANVRADLESIKQDEDISSRPEAG